MKKTLTSIAISLLLLSGCATDLHARAPDPKQEVAAAFARYQDAVLRADSDAVSALFETNASVAHDDLQPVIGRSSIRSRLETFAGYKLVPYDVDIKSTRMQGAAVVQSGDYRQVMTAPNGDTLYLHGTFRATWVRQPTGAWLIESMETVAS